MNGETNNQNVWGKILTSAKPFLCTASMLPRRTVAPGVIPPKAECGCIYGGGIENGCTRNSLPLRQLYLYGCGRTLLGDMILNVQLRNNTTTAGCNDLGYIRFTFIYWRLRFCFVDIGNKRQLLQNNLFWANFYLKSKWQHETVVYIRVYIYNTDEVYTTQQCTCRLLNASSPLWFLTRMKNHVSLM